MCVFSLVCLNPRVLLFAPHLLLLWVLARNYQQRAELVARARRTGQDPNKVLQASSKKPVNPASFKPDQISYKQNMQFIQNTMGMYSDIYENLRLLNTKIDWSDEQFTMRVMRWCVVSALVLLIVSPYIPWNVVIMLGGLSAFVMNTALGKTTAEVLCKNLEANGLYGMCMAAAKSLQLPKRRRSSSDQRTAILLRHSTVTVECVENQRWWAGLGWYASIFHSLLIVYTDSMIRIPHMLKTERSAWSNYYGDANTVPKEDLIDPLPLIQQGFAYEKPDLPEAFPGDAGNRHVWRWVPDSTWEVSMHLCTGEDITDEDGWVYTDHNWAQPEERDSVRCLTRRRRWIRQAQVLE